ncbi:MAG: hypothetical protein QXI07_07555 [Pyrobaculum sp.]
MLRILLAVLVAVALASAQSFVLVDLDVGDKYPYVVVGDVLEPLPLVHVYVNKSVYLAEAGEVVTMPVYYGTFLAVPRSAFNNFTRAHPKAVDVEVRGLGKFRLVPADNSTDLHRGPPPVVKTPRGSAVEVAHRIEYVVEAEEKNGQLFVRGRPLEIRRPEKSPKIGGKKNDTAVAQPMGSRSGSTNTYINPWDWDLFYFAPFVYLNPPRSPYYTSYRAARYYIATDFDIYKRRYVFAPLSDARTAWAYFGKGVVKVYVLVSWSKSDPEPNPVYVELVNTTNPANFNTTIRNVFSSWSGERTLNDIAYIKLVSFDVSAYSDYYVYVYADARDVSGKGFNISIAAAVKRPAQGYSVYALLPGHWKWMAMQPGRVLTLRPDPSTTNSIYSVTFIARYPQGFRRYAFLYAQFDAKTCSNTNSLTVNVMLGALNVATATSSTYRVDSDGCRVFSFNLQYTVDMEQATRFYFTYNATRASPLTLMFSPALSGSYARLTIYRLELRGIRWPEIWWHNSKTWLNNTLIFKSFSNLYNIDKEKVYRSMHLRDVFTFNVWYDDASYTDFQGGEKANRRAAWVTITHAGLIRSGTGDFSTLISKAYIDLYHTPFSYQILPGVWVTPELKKVCIATERPARTDNASDIYYADNRNFLVDALVAGTSAFVTAASTVLTFLAFTTMGQGLGEAVAGAVLWGLDLTLTGVKPSATYGCGAGMSPEFYFFGVGYDAGTGGNIRTMTWNYHITFGFSDTMSWLARLDLRAYPEGLYSVAGLRYATISRDENAFAISLLYARGEYTSAMFSGPEEPFALGWSGFYVRFG